MLGKTHFIVGAAATMAVTAPKNISEMALAVGIGGLGACISDIDAGNSESHHSANKIIMLTALLILGVVLLDQYCQTGILRFILKNRGYTKVIIGILIFIGLCAFGKEQPHRSFMHSFFALGLFCFAMSLVWKKAVFYFAIGFLSHLALDIFNKKKVRIFYPFQGGIALGWFRADGLVNRILFALGSGIVVLEIIIFIVGI